MFYCEKCAKELKYPESMSKLFGICEICYIVGQCNNVPNNKLPKPEISKENMIRRIELYGSVYALFLTKLPPKKLFDRFFDYSFETGGDGFTDMQEFVISNLKKEFYWSTSIGIIEAIDHIVEEAISNGNIQKF